jgi:hypothetical protein
MPTFIKPGFWNIKRKQLAGELNLDQLVESKIPAAKYKVFTALLTQNGVDNTNTTYGDGPIVEGITYLISTNPDNYDLAFYGAPNNNPGTIFIANQTTTLPYTNTLQLSFNDGAPVATVLENTIGNIWFGCINTGQYSVNSDKLFKEDKTTIDIDNFGGNAVNLETNPFYIANETIINDERQFYIFTTRVPDYRDGVLQKNRLEIRVYN